MQIEALVVASTELEKDKNRKRCSAIIDYCRLLARKVISIRGNDENKDH